MPSDMHHPLNSPAASGATAPPRTLPPAQNTGFDDVFGTSPPLAPDLSAAGCTSPQPPTELSDLPIVRRQHVTAGYRDGVSAAKSAYVQHGFDAGFPVGAQLGIRVGVVLGVLEGLVHCMPATETKGLETGTHKDSTTIQSLLDRARGELAIQAAFGSVLDDNDSKAHGGDPIVRLEQAGEEVIARWEATITKLLDRS